MFQSQIFKWYALFFTAVNTLVFGLCNSCIHHSTSTSPAFSMFGKGWDSLFQLHFDNNSEAEVFPARIAGVYKNSFLVNQGNKELLVTAAGRLNHKRKSLFPVIGDWVTIADKVISDVLPRKNILSRGAAGAHGKQEMQPNKEQVIAANLDTIFIVSGTDRDFNIRRIERYLTLVYNCVLNPVIILTKADLHQNPERFVSEVKEVTFGVPVHLVSANASHGLMSLEKYISGGKTISMLFALDNC